MLRKYQLCDGKIEPVDNGGHQISVYINPNDDEKKYLINELKLDEHTLTSALDPDELSRLEFEPEHVALIFKRPKSYSASDRFFFRVSSVGIFLFKDQIIIVTSEDFPMFDDKKPVKTKSLKEVMLRFLYRSIYHFLEHLKIINQISDDLEEKINASLENRYLFNLFTLEKSMVYYLNAINANSVMLQKLKNNAPKITFSSEEEEFLEDIVIENNQCYKQAEIYSNILSGMMDARASLVSNNLNVLMKTLNIITIGIMVPTFVVSAFSMNVGIPFAKHPFAFWIVMGIALVSVFGFYFFWRFKKW